MRTAKASIRHSEGYVLLRMPDHPRAHRGYVYEHVVVAERALGRPLPAGAEVHHINENTADNRPANLVICPDHAYHALLHRRMRALAACGHVDWLRCQHCHEWGAPATMRVVGTRPYQAAHPNCRTRAGNARRARRCWKGHPYPPGAQVRRGFRCSVCKAERARRMEREERETGQRIR